MELSAGLIGMINDRYVWHQTIQNPWNIYILIEYNFLWPPSAWNSNSKEFCLKEIITKKSQICQTGSRLWSKPLICWDLFSGLHQRGILTGTFSKGRTMEVKGFRWHNVLFNLLVTERRGGPVEKGGNGVMCNVHEKGWGMINYCT